MEFSETQYPDSGDEAEMGSGPSQAAVGGDVGSGVVGAGVEEPLLGEVDMDDYDIPMSPEAPEEGQLLPPQGVGNGAVGTNNRWQSSVRSPLKERGEFLLGNECFLHVKICCWLLTTAKLACICAMSPLYHLLPVLYTTFFPNQEEEEAKSDCETGWRGVVTLWASDPPRYPVDGVGIIGCLL